MTRPGIEPQSPGPLVNTNFCKFVAAKFNLNSAFVQLFKGSKWIKIRIYIVYILS